MRFIRLAGFLLTLTTVVNSRVIKRRKNDNNEDIHRFQKEETEMFKGQGLWFYDDQENLVQAILNETQLIAGDVGIRINLDDLVFFKLFTRETKNGYQSLYIDDDFTFSKSNFNPKRPTKFITHGWMNSFLSPACTLIKEAYLQLDDYNVIVVDWSEISIGEYIFASRMVKKVGRYVAAMIDFLEKKGMDPTKTTLIGHSLGAHVMGLAGYFASNTVNYVVGLDPALPLFALATESSRISLASASYVEIIHTNAGLLGYKDEIGHTDFYPNGGSIQLGCQLDITGACSHSRAYKFFAESIISKAGFYGKKCDDFASYKKGKCKGEVAKMGDSKQTLGVLRMSRITGKFYLETRENPPFAVGPVR